MRCFQQQQQQPLLKSCSPVIHSRLRSGQPNPTDAEVASFYCPGCSQICCLQFLSPPFTHFLSLYLSPPSLLPSPILSPPITLQVAALCQRELPFQLQTSPSLITWKFLQLLNFQFFHFSQLFFLPPCTAACYSLWWSRSAEGRKSTRDRRHRANQLETSLFSSHH